MVEQDIEFVEAEECTPTDCGREAAECAAGFVHSFAHSFVQGPIDGIREVVNTIASKPIIPKVELIKRPEKAPFGTAKKQAQQIGSGAGLIAAFVVIGNLIVRRRII